MTPHPQLGTFLRPHSEKYSLWRWIGGLALILLLWLVVGAIPLITMYALQADDSLIAALSNRAQLYRFMETRLGFALNLSAFIMFAIGIFWVQKGLFGKTTQQIITGANRIRWRKVFGGFVGCAIIFCAYNALVYYLYPGVFRYNFNPETFAVFFIIVLILTPVQSGAEELLFRGYLSQAVGQWISSPIVVFVLTSAIFAAFHLINPGAFETPVFYLFALFAMGMGMSALVYFEGGLESAIGFHTANNIFIFTLVGYKTDGLPAQAVFMIESSGTSGTVLAALAQLAFVVASVVTILWINRRFDKSASDPKVIG